MMGSRFFGLPLTKTDKKSTSRIRLSNGQSDVVVTMKNESGYLHLLNIGEDSLRFIARDDGPRNDLEIDSKSIPMPFDDKYEGMLAQAGLHSLTQLSLFPEMLTAAVDGLHQRDRKSPEFARALLTVIVVSFETAREDRVRERVIYCCRCPVPRSLGFSSEIQIRIWGKISRFYNYYYTKIRLIRKVCNIEEDLLLERMKKIKSAIGILKCTTPRKNPKGFLEDFEKDITNPEGLLYAFFENMTFELEGVEIDDRTTLSNGRGGGRRQGQGGRHFGPGRGGQQYHPPRQAANENSNWGRGRGRGGHNYQEHHPPRQAPHENLNWGRGSDQRRFYQGGHGGGTRFGRGRGGGSRG